MAFQVGDLDETKLLGARTSGSMNGSSTAALVEEGDAIAFTVYRQTTNSNGTYGVSTIGGAGFADEMDFTGTLSGTVSFGSGSLTGTIMVFTNEDSAPELDEDFTVTLSGSELSFENGSFGSAAQSMTGALIVDDDADAGGFVTVFHESSLSTFTSLTSALTDTATLDGDTVVIGDLYDSAVNGNSGTIFDDDLTIRASGAVTTQTPIVLTLDEQGDGEGTPFSTTLAGTASFELEGNTSSNFLYSNGYSSVEGGQGDDSIYGTEDEDVGQPGDTLSGGRGEDILYGALNVVNTLDGFFGEQEIDTSGPVPNVTGVAENDTIYGGDTDDRILANGGGFDPQTESLVGDRVYAGGGSDSIFIYGQTQPALIDGDEGRPEPENNGTFTDVTIANAAVLAAPTDVDTLYIFNIPGDRPVQFDPPQIRNVEEIVVTGGSEYNFRNVGAGADPGITLGLTIRVLGADDTADLPIDSATKMALAGSNAFDTAIFGTGYDDTISGGQGNDTLDGSGGLDVLTGGAGSDVYLGDDPLILSRVASISDAAPPEATNSIAGDTIVGAQGGERVFIYGSTSGTFTATLTGTILSVDLNGDGDFDDVEDFEITVENAVRDGLTITVTAPQPQQQPQQMLQALDEWSPLFGPGIITFVAPAPGGDGGGGGGNPSPGAFTFTEFDDVYTGSEESERLVALAGNDSVEGSLGNDNIAGKTGDDTLRGGQGNDTLFGGQGNDRVFGDTGDDTIFGNLGNDIVSGNQGNDTVSGGQGNDTVFGGQGNDRMFGGQGDDLVFGNLGDDLVSGNMGNDLVNGGQGNDTLYGGQGNDTIVGGLGNDLLFGNLGADRFVFGTNSGMDRVGGFSQSSGDRLDLQGQTFTTSTGPDGSAVLTLSGGGTVTLTGVAPGSVNPSFFA